MQVNESTRAKKGPHRTLEGGIITWLDHWSATEPNQMRRASSEKATSSKEYMELLMPMGMAGSSGSTTTRRGAPGFSEQPPVRGCGAPVKPGWASTGTAIAQPV